MVLFLNKSYPELQESAQLTVKPHQSLNALEKLQLQKLKAQLNENITTPPSVNKKIKQSIVAVFVAFLLAALVIAIPFSKQNMVNKKVPVLLSNISKPEVKLARNKRRRHWCGAACLYAQKKTTTERLLTLRLNRMQ